MHQPTKLPTTKNRTSLSVCLSVIVLGVTGCESSTDGVSVMPFTPVETVEQNPVAESAGTDNGTNNSDVVSVDSSATDSNPETPTTAATPVTDADTQTAASPDTAENTTAVTAENNPTDTDSASIENASGAGDENTQPAEQAQTTESQTDVPAFDAEYRVTFTTSWSVDTHPLNFPANPHFSPLVGAVHGDQAILWEVGQLATTGIESMAETGATATLLEEAATAVSEGRALSTISAGGIALSPGNVNIDRVGVTSSHPKITLVSMLAPSPDWFVGVSGQNLIGNNGEFANTIMLDLILYDAGTDSGLRYTSPNENTQPQSPISVLTSDPLDTNFANGAPVVGQLLFERIQ